MVEESDLEVFVTNVKQLLEDHPSMSERQARQYIFDEFLRLLKWSPSNPRLVKVEYPIKIGTRDVRVDYVLFKDSSPFIIFETKAPAYSISDDHIQQARSYAKLLNCKLLILANVNEWKFCGTEENNPILTITLETLPKNVTLLKVLSYDSETVDIMELIKKLQISESAAKLLDEAEDDLVEVIVGWVREKINAPPDDESVIQIIRDAIINYMSQESSPPVTTAKGTTGGGSGEQEFHHTTRRDWEQNPGAPKGVYRYKNNHSIIIDVRKRGGEVRSVLRKFGLDSITQAAFGGFIYNLRQDAGLVRPRT